MENRHQVSFPSKGRFSLLGDLNLTTQSILFVFHGQGQLANFFIKKFESLRSLGITVIAPEGLHNYYLAGFKGRVGSSWMTSENRSMAIENYLSYLNALFQQVESQISLEAKYSVLGFSQGAATASRWIEQSHFDFAQFILWGGTLPPDLNKELIHNRMKQKQLMQVFGKQDPYISSENRLEIKMLAKSYNIASKYKLYEGGHDIDTVVLKDLINPV